MYDSHFALNESLVSGTSEHISTHYTYQRYLEYADTYLQSTSKPLCFVPEHLDDSYYLHTMSNQLYSRYLREVIRAKPDSLPLLCAHDWYILEPDDIEKIQYHGDIRDIIHSFHMSCILLTNKGFNKIAIQNHGVGSILLRLRDHNPSVYELIRQQFRSRKDDYRDKYPVVEYEKKYPLSRLLKLLDQYLS